MIVVKPMSKFSFFTDRFIMPYKAGKFERGSLTRNLIKKAYKAINNENKFGFEDG